MKWRWKIWPVEQKIIYFSSYLSIYLFIHPSIYLPIYMASPQLLLS